MSGRVETIGECTLILGDCRDILPTLGRFGACVTDPPYGIGIAANPVRQKFERSQWDAAPPDATLFDLVREITDEQIIWGGNYFGLPASQGFLIWDKVQPENFSLSMCEMAWCSRQAPAKIWRQSVLSYPKEHPTQKPTALMEWCLGKLSSPTSVVDPFMGSGTTGVACVALSLKFTGIEIDPAFFDIACRRIEAAYKQPRLFAEPQAQPKQEALL
jgi:site-specific DNA-methyltransferase (adenine-specific)